MFRSSQSCRDLRSSGALSCYSLYAVGHALKSPAKGPPAALSQVHILTYNVGMIASRIDSIDSMQQPVFSSLAEERQHRKERLAASFRLFSKFGFDEGVAGHITARDPELSDHLCVNPFAQQFGE